MMRINQKNKLISCLTIALAIFLCPVTQAQQNKFRYKADVAKVDSDGVYKIELQPSLIAKCVQKGLYDIRLVDSHGKFVAYIISDGQSSENRADYIDFPGAKTPNGNDTATVYIAENIKQLWINKLWLKLRNTTVDRNINLEGSDDGIKWFAIKENISLQPAKDENNTNYEQVLNFPESNYRYFIIQVSGKNKVPVKIISSGIYVDKSPAKAEYTQLPDPKFTIKDTDRITTILLHFDQEYLINKLKLDIKAPRYYTRRALIHNRTGAYYYEVGGYVLSNSSGNPDMTFSEKTKKLRIDINNRDDNPLTIASIKAYQQKQFAVAYLEKGEKYYLLAGDSSAHEVSYDLSFLIAKPVSGLKVISHSAVVKNPAYATQVITVKRDYTQLIWISIAVVLILLSLLTWRMVKELNAKNTGNTNS